MLSIQEGKNIAGRLFVDRFGHDFVRNNINRLGTGIIRRNKEIIVDFDIAEKDLDEYLPLFEMNKNDKEEFPEIIFRVLVDLRTGSAKALDIY